MFTISITIVLCFLTVVMCVPKLMSGSAVLKLWGKNVVVGIALLGYPHFHDGSVLEYVALRETYCSILSALSAFDVSGADSMSITSVLGAFALCLHVSLIMFCSADTLSGIVNSSLVTCSSFLSSLQIRFNWSFFNFNCSKILRSLLRRSLPLICCSKSFLY